jgi:glycosyltransferase involved in cell wall biosynthesis
MVPDGMPRVQGIMPYHGAHDWLGAAIAGWLEQTLSDWELWVVFDGPDAEAFGLAEEAAAGDGRVKLVEREHSGPYVQRNWAYAQGSAPFVVWWDADTLFLQPDTLETWIGELEGDPEAAWVYTDYVASRWAWRRGALVRTQVETVLMSNYSPDFNVDVLTADSFIPGVSMAKRDALGAPAPDWPWETDPRVRGRADWDLFLSLALGPDSPNGRRVGLGRRRTGRYLPGLWFETALYDGSIGTATFGKLADPARFVLAKHGLDPTLADRPTLYNRDREGLIADLLAQRERGTERIRSLERELAAAKDAARGGPCPVPHCPGRLAGPDRAETS